VSLALTSQVLSSFPSYYAIPVYQYMYPYSLQSFYHHQLPVVPSIAPVPHTHIPACAGNGTKSWCLEDPEYPAHEVKKAVQNYFYTFTSFYADVGDLDTRLSVSLPRILEEETYLCDAKTSYVRPLRARNTDGKWRIIVNNIKANYETYTQTARLEECLIAGKPCPLVPSCHASRCLQKNMYHRFLVYDPYDQHFPLALETFKLPSSCACLLGAYFL
ncbi:Spaetzle, partial [Halocaridina rubra]